MRHNILIVDDEQLIRQGLRARIEYLGIDVDEIFEAENGLIALRLQEEHPIDVVITYIRMPDMDGLELIQEMQKKNNQIKFVVLSGYAEFSYAETAIRLGVKAYLLKPVSNDDLKAAFDKAYKEMEQTASVRQEVQMKKRMDREKQVYQQEKALNALFSSQEAGAVTREQLCKLCGYDEKMWAGGAESVLYLAILHINKESFEHQRFRPVDHELVRFMIRNIFEEIQAPCEKLLVNSLSDTRQMYGIFIGDDKKKLRMEVERIYLRMRSVLEKKMGIYLTIGVSRCRSQLEGKETSEARQALKQRIIYGKANIYFYEDIRILGEQEFPVSQLHLLEQYIEHNEIFKVKNLVQEIFSEELVKKYGSAYLRIMWIRILNLLLHHYERRGRNAAEIEKMLQNYNLLDRIQSLQEIRQKIIEMVMECVSTESVADANARSKIQMAIGYIQEHFAENLTVNVLAEHYGMSPNYFSSMFKKEMSRSAVNYITELRINQARELLYHSELSVVDISKKVGYEDSQYFFRVFKKYLGMTPLQYREESRK
ncbi:MAG: response regulator [Lachnospiraceae bacterium]|nr:response regulator [Lachnospiraceae bacterium]